MTIPRILSSKAYSWAVDGPMQRNYSGVQAKVLDVTSNDALGPTITLMYEIAQMTYNSDMLVEVVSILDSRLKDEPRNHWSVSKSLTVIEYILRYGSQTFAHYYHDNIDTLKALMTFRYIDSYGDDEGAFVRKKATEIVEHILSEPGVYGQLASAPLLPSESSTQSGPHFKDINEGSQWALDTELQHLLRPHDNTPGITTPTTHAHTRQDFQSNTTLTMLIAVLTDQQHYRLLLDDTSLDEAQILFEVCQTLLDSSEIAFEYRGQIIALMQRLASKTESFPSYLFIHGPISLVLEQPAVFGGFGDIYKATLHHETLCLKVLRRRAETKSFKAFAKEYILWSQLSHPNVLPFYGLHNLHWGQISLVSPWAENGNLKEFLSQESHGTTVDRILLCLDTAMGVEYLHANGVVHGDIKSVNVVVDGAGRAYLVDFGLSNIDDPQIAHWTSQSLVASQGGTVRWQAPELYPDESDLEAEEIVVTNTKMSDVYAWGCLVYEIFTGRLPFHNARFSSTVVVKVMKGQVPSRPPDGDPAWLIHGLNESIWKLMGRCWAFNPTARPTMAAIVSSLKSERPATFKDPCPPPQWPAGSAVRFRNSQNVGRAGRAHTLKDLEAILLKVTGLEV
ncbi:hypothetical protein DXG01_009996 [Tephrocybe rancida]|nr:hypothetical protein DXG01_009996 [Tephrocybe rancida]